MPPTPIRADCVTAIAELSAVWRARYWPHDARVPARPRVVSRTCCRYVRSSHAAQRAVGGREVERAGHEQADRGAGRQARVPEGDAGGAPG